MSFLFLVAALQAAPPVIDPILDPTEARQGAVEREIARPRNDSSTQGADAMERSSRLLDCLRLAESDSQTALAAGARWLLEGGGIEAELCVGAGHEAAQQWAEAEQAYLRAGDLAAVEDDQRRGAIQVSAGRMALARGEPALAKTRFDEVLGATGLPAEFRGFTLLERARAHVALGDGNGAQADLIEAQRLLPNESAAWLLSATLARRQGDLDAASDFIDRALELDQSDPAILLEAGNIAIRLNAIEVAREAWGMAQAADPAGADGQAAARNLERLDAMLASGPTVPVDLPETTNDEATSEEPES